MQSIQLSKEPIYAIPDKVRWDAWWLIPMALTRHVGEGRHPRLSLQIPAIRQESNPRPTARTP